VKHWQIAMAILAALSASLALADDFKTVNGIMKLVKSSENRKQSRHN
jgi:hypothetical protein